MMRYRITARGDGMELRGYFDGELDRLGNLATAMKPYGVVVASPAESDYNPFAISEPENPPTPEASIDIILGMWDSKESQEDFLSQVAMVHYAQANVIRGERGRAERAEKAGLSRELHHFETEQENARLEADNARLLAVLEAVRAARANHPECDVHKEDDPVTCGWKRAVQEIDRALVKTA